jgi:large subunit ribosomal protein L24
MKIKKGDHVMVTVGKDKGATGTVIAAYPKLNRVVVQGVNMVKKNKKETNQSATGPKTGGVVTQEAPIHVSNVQIVDPDTKKPARVGYKINEDGAKVRVLRPSGKEI